MRRARTRTRLAPAARGRVTTHAPRGLAQVDDAHDGRRRPDDQRHHRRVHGWRRWKPPRRRREPTRRGPRTEQETAYLKARLAVQPIDRLGRGHVASRVVLARARLSASHDRATTRGLTSRQSSSMLCEPSYANAANAAAAVKARSTGSGFSAASLSAECQRPRVATEQASGGCAHPGRRAFAASCQAATREKVASCPKCRRRREEDVPWRRRGGGGVPRPRQRMKRDGEST